MLSPLISVIVPVYNAARYLSRCVDSILQQTFTDFELLLVDDGSTDRSGAICAAYCDRDPRCKGVHLAHGGVSRARNAGLEQATGAYIAFIDADDYVHPQYLEILYEAARNHSAELAAAGFESVPDDCPRPAKAVASYRTGVLSQRELVAALFADTRFMVVWGKLYRREVLTACRFADHRIAEDVEFNARVYQRVHTAVAVDAALYGWVDRASSVTRVAFSQQDLDAVESYRLSLEHMPKHEPYYRACALERLYKVLLSTRYRATAGFRAPAAAKMRTVLAQTVGEFRHSRQIPAGRKWVLLAFCRLPFLYRFFRWSLELRAKTGIGVRV